jgi:hypothetical protein
LEKQENKEEKHAQDAQEAEGFVVGNAAAEDGFEIFVEEDGFVEAIEHAEDEAQDADSEGGGHGDE